MPLEIMKAISDMGIVAAQEIIITAAEKAFASIKNNREWEQIFVKSGRSIFSDENQEELFNRIKEVFSKDNMALLAKDLRREDGYDIKEKLYQALIELLGKYEIPREYAEMYALQIIYRVLEELRHIDPHKYERYFLKEWKDEQDKKLGELQTRIDQMSSDIEKYHQGNLEIKSSGTMDIELRRCTSNPSIGIEFFIVDDKHFQDEFEDRINDEVVYVRGRCREETIYCILNELWKREEKRPIYVVESIESWNKLRNMDVNTNIYIPCFYADEIPAIEGNTNIFVLNDNTPAFSRDVLEMKPRTIDTLSKCLNEAGLSYEKVSEIIKDTHGLYLQMKKKLYYGAYSVIPPWVDKLSKKAQKTCLLLDRWEETEGDKLIVEYLYEDKYDRFIEEVEEFARGEDTLLFTTKRNGIKAYCLSSTDNIWAYVEVSTDEDIWKRFEEMVRSVLNESEKQFTLDGKELLYAQIKGEKPFWSERIRKGMLKTLKRKSVYGTDYDDRRTIDVLIEDLMHNINTKDQWIYISRFWRDLCEISPEVVMKRMANELDDNTGMLDLFINQSEDVLFGRNPYIEILWGIEQLLTQKEYFGQALKILIGIDSHKYKYTSNTPKDIFEKVFCPWASFSAIHTAEAKISAAERALKLDIDNMWDYLYAAIDNNGRSIVGHLLTPQYREYASVQFANATEYQEVRKGYFNLLVNRTEFSVDRWKSMLHFSESTTNDMRNIVFNRLLDEENQMSDEEKISIKNHIRKIIYKHRYFSSASWSMRAEDIVKYEKLLDEITISTPEYEYEYIFDSDTEPLLLNPASYESEGSDEINKKLIDEIIRAKVIEFKNKKLNLATLVEVCAKRDNSNLGIYLARYSDDNEFNQEIFEILYNGQDSKIMAQGYCQGMYYKDEGTFEKVLRKKEELHFDSDFIVKLYRLQARYSKEIPQIASADISIKESFWKDEKLYIGNNYEWALMECKEYGTVYTYIQLLYRAYRDRNFDEESLYNYIIDIHKMPFDERIRNSAYYLAELLEPIQIKYADDSEKAGKIVEIEIEFSGMLEWKNMKCFQNEIKRTPDIYGEMASIVYKKDDEDRIEERTKEQNDFINAIHNLYSKANFCPAEKNGIVDINELDIWVNKFKSILYNNHQSSLFGFLLGRLWIYSPVGEDDLYPCEAVRNIIEEYADDSMVSEYKVAMYNQRGVYSPSAGRAERELAEGYKKNAELFENSYPKTAEIFYGMYRTYIVEAEKERNRAENDYF